MMMKSFFDLEIKKAKKYVGLTELHATSREVMIFQKVDKCTRFCVSKADSKRRTILPLYNGPIPTSLKIEYVSFKHDNNTVV